MTPKLRAFTVALLLVVCADLASKWAVERSLEAGDRTPLIEGFLYLCHARNTSAAFGLLSGWEYPAKLGVLVAVFAVVLALVMRQLRSLAPGDRRSSPALGAVLGGALGNLLGRLRDGDVVDVLLVQLSPSDGRTDAHVAGALLNLADVALVVGAGWLLLDLLMREGSARATPDRSARSPRGS